MEHGQILRSRYQIIKFLGSGGFGETHLAQDVDLPGNPKCVVKHLKPKSSEPEVLDEAKKLFEIEAETLYKFIKCYSFLLTDKFCLLNNNYSHKTLKYKMSCQIKKLPYNDD